MATTGPGLSAVAFAQAGDAGDVSLSQSANKMLKPSVLKAHQTVLATILAASTAMTVCGAEWSTGMAQRPLNESVGFSGGGAQRALASSGVRRSAGYSQGSLPAGSAPWHRLVERTNQPALAGYRPGYPSGYPADYQPTPDQAGYRNAVPGAGSWGYQMDSTAYLAHPQRMPASARPRPADDSDLFAPVPKKPPSGMPRFGSGSSVDDPR